MLAFFGSPGPAEWVIIVLLIPLSVWVYSLWLKSRRQPDEPSGFPVIEPKASSSIDRNEKK